jgi:hypothetical protein
MKCRIRSVTSCGLANEPADYMEFAIDLEMAVAVLLFAVWPDKAVNAILVAKSFG